MITELRISLRGRLSESADLAGLMRAEAPISPGCRGGRVDSPGLD
jgi:hypothetical protein